MYAQNDMVCTETWLLLTLKVGLNKDLKLQPAELMQIKVLSMKQTLRI